MFRKLLFHKNTALRNCPKLTKKHLSGSLLLTLVSFLVLQKTYRRLRLLLAGLPTQDPQLAKNYEQPFLLHNQFGCYRLFLEGITLIIFKEHQPKTNSVVRNQVTSKAAAHSESAIKRCSVEKSF